VGSRLTRPQARAATPLQLRETATIPIESGPGYMLNINSRSYIIGTRYKIDAEHMQHMLPAYKDCITWI
jgi:hypothetical protein